MAKIFTLGYTVSKWQVHVLSLLKFLMKCSQNIVYKSAVLVLIGNLSLG